MNLADQYKAAAVICYADLKVGDEVIISGHTNKIYVREMPIRSVCRVSRIIKCDYCVEGKCRHATSYEKPCAGVCPHIQCSSTISIWACAFDLITPQGYRIESK